jgi:hypothetical protein
MDTIKTKAKAVLEKIHNHLSNHSLLPIGIFAAILIIVGIIIAGWKKSDCSEEAERLKKLYPDMAKLRPIDINASYIVSQMNKGEVPLLRDFYIKTSYNSCATGPMKHGLVCIEALKQVIRQGARCLDFEIYAINNEPVVAVSSTNDITFKQSYNSIPLSEVLQAINEFAFSPGFCANASDPLLLNFRLKTDITGVWDKQIASIIFQTLEKSNRLLPKEYSYEYGGKNLGNVAMEKLMGKAIIIFDGGSNISTFKGTEIDEYINIRSGGPFLRAMPGSKIINTHQVNETINFNKKNMSIARPELSIGDNNPLDFHKLFATYGVQMVAMNFQNLDESMKSYNKLFEETGSAYILKPKRLRYELVTIPAPPKQDPKLSYANRNVKGSYYSFKI